GELCPRADEEGPPPACLLFAAVGDPPRYRVEQDVPGRREEDDQAGDTGGDAEPVGEVGQEQEPGNRPEGPRGDRAEPVPTPHPCRQPRRSRVHALEVTRESLSGTTRTAGLSGQGHGRAHRTGRLLPMRQIRQSRKLKDVRYDVRGPILVEAQRLEAEGHKILKLNI